jgi:FixJ family two-component response regulator
MHSIQDSPLLVAIVDDNAPLREALENLLKAVGYGAKGYGSAEAFLSCRDGWRSACLILDANLPGISGHDLHDALRVANDPVPVIFISGYEDRNNELKTRALQSGALAFLRKPFCTDELLRIVHEAMAPRARRQ